MGVLEDYLLSGFNSYHHRRITLFRTIFKLNIRWVWVYMVPLLPQNI